MYGYFADGFLNNITLLAIGLGSDRSIASFHCHCKRESKDITQNPDDICFAGVKRS